MFVKCASENSSGALISGISCLYINLFIITFQENDGRTRETSTTLPSLPPFQDHNQYPEHARVRRIRRSQHLKSTQEAVHAGEVCALETRGARDLHVDGEEAEEKGGTLDDTTWTII